MCVECVSSVGGAIPETVGTLDWGLVRSNRSLKVCLWKVYLVSFFLLSDSLEVSNTHRELPSSTASEAHNHCTKRPRDEPTGILSQNELELPLPEILSQQSKNKRHWLLL